MELREYKSKRLIATTTEEKSVVKSWGSQWSRFRYLERAGKPIRLIFGDWSGYRSSQYRITHVALAPSKVSNDFHGTVQFSDNTTMGVWVKVVSRQDILTQKLYARNSYGSLIGKLIDSGETFYKV